MGLPFRSGHVLGLRRFPASSIGPGYRSVWHRDPHGRWTFYQDQPAELACTRYFGSAVDEVREGPIRIEWTGPRGFQVPAADGELEWTVEVGSTPVTRLFNRAASALPARAQRAAVRRQPADHVGGDRQHRDRARRSAEEPSEHLSDRLRIGHV
jgi:hypothetical protein